ncbi:MAG: MG2 domain-containing protein [Saprospiraceae bacterium]|nr:MG2 domain-containing protein [Saprospiraceae bacterium]
MNKFNGMISLILLAFLIQCKPSIPPAVNAALAGKVLRSYTQGIISTRAALRFVFIEDVATESDLGKALPEKLILIKPSVPGKLYWEAKNTLVFKPEGRFESGTQYDIQVDLKSINPMGGQEFPTLSYQINTRENNFSVARPTLIVNPSEVNLYDLTGEVQLADFMETADVEKLLTAEINNQALTIRWQHQPENLTSLYTIKNIPRTKDAEVHVNWDGQPLQIKQSGSHTTKIPGPDEFILVDVQFDPNPEPHVVASFSDVLKNNQNLAGLVFIKSNPARLRTVIDANKVMIYFGHEVNGDIVLTVAPGVQSVDNKKITESTEWTVHIANLDPAVKFTGKGTIIPQSDELILPFEAVGLKALDIEIFKIFDQNILQFLQINQLDEENELDRVGKLIHQSKIDLAMVNPRADASHWSHYAIDLKPLVEVDPNAIYQVRIGFKPSYTRLTCLSGYEEEEDFNYSEELVSFYEDNYYGPAGYYENYLWEDRDDPCKPAYYNNDHFISKNILISNLGIVAKKSDKNLFAAITDLRTADPIPGARIDVYNFTLQKIAQLTVDQSGLVNQLLSEPAYALVVSNQGQKGYLRMADGYNLSTSAFEVDGEQVKKGIKGFIYAERGVWRPGDSIHLNFILNNLTSELPAQYPVHLQLFDAQNKRVLQKLNSQPIQGIYSFPIKTSSDAITGNWRAVIKAGGAEFSKTLKIEAIKPNRLKIHFELGEEIQPSQHEALLEASWLTGIKTSGLHALVTGQWRPASSGWQAYKEFIFQDPARSGQEQPVLTLFDGNLDPEGKAMVPLKISKDFKPAGKMNLNFKIDVSEPGGDFSTFNHSAVFHPYLQYAGIKLPSDPWGYKTLNINKPTSIQFVSIDPKGNYQRNRKLSIGVYELDWRWWWEDYGGGYAGYNSSDHVKAVQKTVVTTDNNGLAAWSPTVNHWGRYLIRVCDVVSGHCSGDFAYAGWPEDERNNFNMATLLRLQSNKERYLADETVEVSIPAPVSSKMLVSIENGTRVLESHWVNIDKSPYVFKFNSRPEMSPAVYIHVTLLQPHGNAANDLPMRLYGILPLLFDHPDTKLNPVIKSAVEFRPDKPATIEIFEHDGKPMAYTINIVDEGLLDLTNFKTPDPHKHFFAKEALGVKTWDIYDQVLGAYGGKIESILSIGGDEGLNLLDEDKVVSRFKSPVIHLGPFELKKGEKRKHEITIRNYVGSVRIMVAAAGKGAYGQTDKTMPVKSPLMILPTLPRVLSVGEKVSLPVNIFITDDKIRRVELSVNDKNKLIRWGTQTKTINISGNGESLEYFEFTTGDQTGKSIIQLEGKANGESARQEIEIEIRNPNPIRTETRNELIQAGQSKTISIKSPLAKGLLSSQVEVSVFQPVQLVKHLDYLIQYPYGCAEQMISSAFPQLYLGQFIDLEAQKIKEIKSNIEGAIASLNKFSLQDGSFSLWPGQQNSSDPWVTSYAGQFLLEAEKKGYIIPQHLLSNWKVYQKKLANLWDPAQKPFYKSNHGMDQAYRLYTLALAGNPELSAMNRLKEYPLAGANAKWRLAAAYALVGQAEVAKSLIQTPLTSEDYVESGYTYGSPLRDMAMAMETYLDLGDQAKAAELALDVSKQLNGGKPWNTQALAYALKVLGRFQTGRTTGGGNWSFRYNIQNGTKKNINSALSSILIDPAVQGKIPESIVIENTSSIPIYVQSSIKFQPLLDTSGDISNHLKLSVTYRNAERQATDPSSLKKGDLLWVEVTITNPGTKFKSYNNLALNHIFPAGWEIINQRMSNIQGPAQLFDYQDIRDDRVMTFFQLDQGKSKTFTVPVRATYEGQFSLPAIVCEEMYDLSVQAKIGGSRVQIDR